MDILNQSIQLSGESLKGINNVVSSGSDILLFDQYTGQQIFGLSPVHGQLVTIKSGGAGTTKELAPSLNNNLYYLVSDVSYNESQTDEIISLATEIPVVLTSGIFIGEFTFLNPNNYENAYFLWDYSDKILNSASYIGITSNRSMSISFNNNAGRCGINYNAASKPTRFQLVVNGGVQKDTGYVGLNTQQNYDDLIAAGVLPSEISLSSPYNGSVNNGKGSLMTVKNIGSLDASVVVSSPFSTSSWSIKKINPYTTSFSINPTKDNTPCGKSTTNTYYHNGSNLTPVVGDIVYSISNVAFIGENLNYYIGNNIFINIDNDGLVTNIDDCYSDGPFAVPYIYEGDLVYPTNGPIKRPVNAIGGPTSWTLVSSSPVSQSIYSNGNWSIDENTAKGEYVITINATNSFGTSPNKTINVSVPDLAVTRPVEMDIGNIHYDSGGSICSASGKVLTTMFFIGPDKFQQLPSKGSFIYYDNEGLRPFNGGGFWYHQAEVALRISAIGSVMDTHTCGGTTTTTTTTTTVPAGTYYNARSCIDPSVEITLLDTASQGIVVGNIIKTAVDLNCWTILSVVSARYPYKLIVGSAVNYASCSACTTISTTTTTTTTTTAPTFTSFSLATNALSSSAYSSCVFASPSYTTHYHNGTATLPVVGDFMYTNNTGTTAFDGQFKWYIMLNVVKFAVNISNTGQVINVIACSTATTTTTTTTIPLRKCIATRCDNNAITQILSYNSANILSVNTVVRDANGLCYTITTATTTGTAYSSILFVFNKCSDCLSKTTTTTTTSTTTSTSTTSTTTSTTTMPPHNSSILDFLELKDPKCDIGVVAEYFTDGDIFVDVLYTDREMTTIAPAGYYKLVVNKQGAIWDGVSVWSNPFSCV
jgi:hypothetical protein